MIYLLVYYRNATKDLYKTLLQMLKTETARTTNTADTAYNKSVNLGIHAFYVFYLFTISNFNWKRVYISNNEAI